MDGALVIALCRHGLTEANTKRAYLGWTDSSLVETPQPLPVEFDGYYTSDLGRCVETMRGFFPYVKANQMPELREMNFGSFEGKTYEQLKGNLAYQRWLTDYEREVPPGGESFPKFCERVERGFRDIGDAMIEHNQSSAFVVTHAGVIRQILVTYAPTSKPYWDWSIGHDTYVQLTFSRPAWEKRRRADDWREIEIHKGENQS